MNDRLDVALACAADGVHLPEQGLPVAAARRLAGEGFIIGRSVHSAAEAVRAQEEGADYVQVGTIFASRSHRARPVAGLALLEAVAAAVRVPILAVGGITAANVGEAMPAGASGAAVISAILGAPSPREAARDLAQAMAAVAREGELMIALTVNGERRELDGPIGLVAFLESVAVDPRYVAVARNGDVVPREEWPGITLEDGDVLEVVRMVGGGAEQDEKGAVIGGRFASLARLRRGDSGRYPDTGERRFGEERGVPEALLVSVTVTYGSAVLFMLARFVVMGDLNLDTPVRPLLYLLAITVVALLAFVGLMSGLPWHYFLGGANGRSYCRDRCPHRAPNRHRHGQRRFRCRPDGRRDRIRPLGAPRPSQGPHRCP